MFCLKHFSSKQLVIFGYCLCILYTGALLMLEGRLNYPLMNDDAGFYIQLTQSAVDQGFANAVNQLPHEKQVPPLLNLVMLFLTRYTSLSIEQSGVGICFFASLLAACGVFFLCRQLYARLDLAIATALLCLSLPCWYRYAGGILRDPLFWMESVWFFGILLKYKQENFSGKKFFLCLILLGILGGAMILTRKEAPMFLLPGGIWFIVPASDFKHGWRKNLLGGFLILAIIVLLSLLPKMAGIDFLPWRLWSVVQEYL